MRVVVTGACGNLGRVVVQLLYDHGFDILAVDIEAPQSAYQSFRAQGIGSVQAQAGKLQYRQIDLIDLGQVYGGLAGADAVVHLGAIPSPTVHPPDVVFRNNILGQFNVFEAAATLGIRRVVEASSVSALGFPYQHRWSEPLYFPVDESHPLLPQDAYGLSKAAGEEVAAAYCRRGAGSAASLRFSTIVGEDRYESFIKRVRGDAGAQAHLLWSYVDLRDAARACLLAVDAPFEGHCPLFVIAADTTSDLPTDTLLQRYFPKVPRRTAYPGAAALAGRWSVIDCTRAQEVLGYRPEYSWPEVLAAHAGDSDATS
jgi:nucleoside-diphosphate-sugar epimerase